MLEVPARQTGPARSSARSARIPWDRPLRRRHSASRLLRFYTPKHLAEKILHDTIAAGARGLGADSPLRSFAWISAHGSGGGFFFFGVCFVRGGTESHCVRARL